MRKAVDMSKLNHEQVNQLKKRALLLDILVIAFVVLANATLIAFTSHPESIRSTLYFYNGLLVALGLLTKKKALAIGGLAGLTAAYLAL